MADGETATRRGTKAGRNEVRKLAATFLNNVGTAWFLAALLQPALAVVREGQVFDNADMASSAGLIAVAALFLAGARAVAWRMED